MTTTAVIGRPEAPSGPPKLTPALLREAQQQTLAVQRLRYSMSARALFKTMDLGYGRAGERPCRGERRVCAEPAPRKNGHIFGAYPSPHVLHGPGLGPADRLQPRLALTTGLVQPALQPAARPGTRQRAAQCVEHRDLPPKTYRCHMRH